MGHVVAMPTTPGVQPKGECPFHKLSAAEFSEWLQTGLQCAAGRREFRLGRYHVSQITNGHEFASELETFKAEVCAYQKIGFLAIYLHNMSECRLAEDELWRLGKVMREAGLTNSVASLISGDTASTPIEVVCPVTGIPTVYEFFSVAFCKNASNPSDPLYDPSLSAPFTAINTTSDAFGFAMLIREQSLKMFGCQPFEIECRDDCELLFRRCVVAWHNMSTTTILNYNKVSVEPSRAVHLSEDRRFWIAPHNDPVFGELEKKPFVHEMPIVYARRACDKWLATIYEGKPYVPSRDGQSGGVAMTFDIDGVPPEVFQDASL